MVLTSMRGGGVGHASLVLSVHDDITKESFDNCINTNDTVGCHDQLIC